MMAILAGMGIAYLAVAAYVWWFLVSTPKIGTRGRPRTYSESMATARREGIKLAIVALIWFPLAIFLVINAPDRTGK